MPKLNPGTLYLNHSRYANLNALFAAAFINSANLKHFTAALIIPHEPQNVGYFNRTVIFIKLDSGGRM